MTLTSAQRLFISERVNTVWKGSRICPACGHTKFSISGILELRDFNEGNHCPGAAITPVVSVHCEKCGCAVLFNAIILGVVDPDTGNVKEEA